MVPEEQVTLAIGGMTCAACARRVEKALQKAPGVSDASVNLATHQAVVAYQPERTAPAALAAAVADAGYRASAPEPDDPDLEHRRDLTRRLAVALIAGVPVIVLGMSHGLIAVPGLPWIELVLSLPVLGWAAAPIYRAALSAIRHRSADMNVLVGLGTLAALGWSVVATVAPSLVARSHHGAAPVYYEAAVAVIAMVLLGRWIEARARRRAGAALRRLRSLVPPTATVQRDGAEQRVAVDQLVAGDLVVIRPGQTIPVDGEVVEGASSVAEAVLTGEAMPLDKRAGDRVFAGTSNGWGRLVVRASAGAEATTLASIVAAVERAMGSRAPIARIADRVGGALVAVVIAIAALTFAAWMLLGGGDDRLAMAVISTVSVLVVACPCALGLATPMALLVGLGRGAELGVVFRSAAALERLGAIDTVVVDKTGTLTEGRPDLVDAVVAPAWPPARLLALVAGAEEGSEHPLAGAFLRAAGAAAIAVPPASEFVATPGRGITAVVDGHRVAVGSARFVREADVTVDVSAIDALTARGLTAVVAAVDGAVAAVYGLGDAPRPGAAEAVRRLRDLGLQVVMLTGDDRRVAAMVGDQLGITEVIAETSPADKAQQVAALRAAGRRVAMIGDGVNDAPALAAADLGIAMGSATDVASGSAEVLLRRDDLAALAATVVLARRTMRTIRANLAWAFAYNLLALPVAAGALYPATGWMLSPMLASAAMALSSLSVVLNSLRLRR